MLENRTPARAFIAHWEGEDFNPADDHGRGSMRGITMTLFEQYREHQRLSAPTAQDLLNLSEDEAAEIMWSELGPIIRFDDLPAGVDLILLDKLYQLGPTGGIRLLESVLNMPGSSINDLIESVKKANAHDLVRDLAVAWGGAKSQSVKWAKHPQDGNDDGHACGPGWINRKVASLDAAYALLPPALAHDAEHPDGCACSLSHDERIALPATADHDLPPRVDHVLTASPAVKLPPFVIPANAYGLKWLPQVLADAGLKVALCDGWATRGHGDVGEITGVLCHHTAGAHAGNMGSLDVITNGRHDPKNPANDLAGPLANLGLARDGTIYMVAAGKAWHAGHGSAMGVVDGNAHFVGIEAENDGLPDNPWPDVQMAAYARTCAAILKHIGQSSKMCLGHKEFARFADGRLGRKNDPTFDMVAFRAKVQAILDTKPVA